MNASGTPTAWQLARSMAQTFQAVRLYPTGHPMRQQSEDRVRMLWGAVLRQGHTIVLDFARSELRIGALVAEAIPPELMVELGPAARQARLSELEISGPDGPERVLDLLRQLSRSTADRAAGRATGAIPIPPPLGASAAPAPAAPAAPVAPPTAAPPQAAPPAARRTSIPVSRTQDNRTGAVRVQPGPAAPAAAPAAPPPATVAPLGGAEIDQALQLLAGSWASIQQVGRRDEAAMRWLQRFSIGRAGDGLSRPVPLVGGRGADPVVAHALDTARLAALAGRAAGASGALLDDLIEAALCADIGMRGVPAELLGRPLRFGHEEFRAIRQHPVLGARWLLATPGCPELAGVVAFEHQMRPDGKGYPQPARAWEMHPVSRVVQACDTYAALRTPRPFRAAVGEPEARALMRRMAGTALDAEVVELLLTRAAPAGCAPFEP